MLALFNYTTFYCPSCGTPTRLDCPDNKERIRFKAHKALTCGICGVMYQLADRTDIFRVATASGSDMIECFVGDDERDESGNGRS